MALLIAALLIAACEAEATPVAAVVPDTPTPEFATATAAPPLRYAITANANGFIPPEERNIIAQTALIDQLNDDGSNSTTRETYDIVAAYGIVPDWDVSPITQQITLVINPALAPLDDEGIISAVQQAQAANALVEAIAIPGAEAISNTSSDANIRAVLANAGYPDGIVLSAIYQNVPGAEDWIAQLGQNNIELQAEAAAISEAIDAILNDDVHLALIAITSDDQRSELEAAVGADNVITLYEISISYIAAPGIEVTFTDSGWPLPKRDASVSPTPSPSAT